MSRASSVVMLLAALLVAVAPAARAEIPAGPDAPTRAAFLRARYEFELRRALDQYRRSPRRDPAQDAAAEAFLTGCARVHNAQPDAPARAELERQGRALVLDGCYDPLVRSFFGRLFVRHDDALPPEVRVATPAQTAGVLSVAKQFIYPDDLARRGYDGAFQAEAIRAVRVIRERISNDEEFKAREPMLIAAVAGAANDAAYGGAGRAFLIHDVSDWTRGLSTDHLLQLADALDKRAGADELLGHLVRGRFHLAAAREGRRDVDHVAEARRLLTRAWELDPALPEAAARMIEVCEVAGARDEGRRWFDRAVKARLDAPEAYAAYFHLLRGTIAAGRAADDAIYAAGLEAARTARFDTDAPRQLVTALDVILKSAGGDYESWNRLGAWAELKKVYAGYVAEPARKADADRHRSALAGFAARVGQYAEARGQLDALARVVDPDGAAEARYRPLDLLGEVHAHTGPLAELTLRAERFASAGNFKQAAEVYDRAAGLPAASAAARRYLRGKSQSARWQQAFDAFEWVDLAADADLSGFAAEAGDWTAEPDGAVTLRVICTESKLMALLEVGEHWELTCDVVFLDAKEQWGNAGVLMFPRRQGGPGHSVQIYNNACKLHAGEAYWGGDVLEFKPERFNALDVRQQGGRTSVTVNGKEMITQRAMAHYGQNGPVRVGLGGLIFHPGDLIRFEHVKIRKLAA